MSFEKEIEKIKKDNIHGAVYLTKKAVKIVENIKNIQDLKKAIKLLKEAQPHMASIYNFAIFIEKNLKNDIKILSKKWLEDFERANDKVIKKASKLIKNKKVLTHSFSSLVYKAFIEAKKQGFEFEVYCTESRPKNEGVVLAQKLCEEGIKCTLILDAAAPFLVKDVDLVLIGADGIGDFGLIHKVGTYPIALAAKEFKKDIYSLSTSFKIYPKDYKLKKIAKNDSKEIAMGCFKVENIYFDITSLKYIKILTEN